MAKRLPALISLFFLVNTLVAQDIMTHFRSQSPSFISVNVGCAFPAGKFSHSTIYGNYDNPYQHNVVKLPLTGESGFLVGGFADPGINVSLNGSWFFTKLLGLGVRASVSQNFLALKKMNTAYDNAYNAFKKSNVFHRKNVCDNAIFP